MIKNILDLSKQLIQIQSVEGNDKALSQALDLALSKLGDFTIEKFEINGVKSALVYNTKKRPKKFKVLLNAHLDIIPGKINQYSPFIKGDRLYGAGAMDMKSNAACMIFVFKQVANNLNYPIALQLVTDEEVGGFLGAGYQVSKGVLADFVLAGEPTSFDIVHKAKGVLKVEISAKGKTAHGAYPWKGDNALWKMNSFLNVLEKTFKNPQKDVWATTVNLSSIKTSNTAANKIPDDCAIILDIRFIEKNSRLVLKKIRSILPKGFQIKILADEPVMLTDKNNPYIQDLARIAKKHTSKKTVIRGANGTSDVNHFSKKSCAGVEFGPVGGGIGEDKEWVSIKSLEIFSKILIDFLGRQS